RASAPPGGEEGPAGARQLAGRVTHEGIDHGLDRRLAAGGGAAPRGLGAVPLLVVGGLGPREAGNVPTDEVTRFAQRGARELGGPLLARGLQLATGAGPRLARTEDRARRRSGQRADHVVDEGVDLRLEGAGVTRRGTAAARVGLGELRGEPDL